VDHFLHGKAFSINRNHNAKAMEKHAKEVSAILGAAKKANKKITVQIRPVSPTVTGYYITSILRATVPYVFQVYGRQSYTRQVSSISS
jgi:hypothetical protein